MAGKSKELNLYFTHKINDKEATEEEVMIHIRKRHAELMAKEHNEYLVDYD